MLYYPRQSRRFDDASCSSVPTGAVLGRLRFHDNEPSEVEHQQHEDNYSLKAQYQQQVGVCRCGFFCVDADTVVVSATTTTTVVVVDRILLHNKEPSEVHQQQHLLRDNDDEDYWDDDDYEDDRFCRHVVDGLMDFSSSLKVHHIPKCHHRGFY